MDWKGKLWAIISPKQTWADIKSSLFVREKYCPLCEAKAVEAAGVNKRLLLRSVVAVIIIFFVRKIFAGG